MVRFRQADQAQEALEEFQAAAAGGEAKQVAGCSASLRLVEGQEEEDYYKRVRLSAASITMQWFHICRVIHIM